MKNENTTQDRNTQLLAHLRKLSEKEYRLLELAWSQTVPGEKVLSSKDYFISADALCRNARHAKVYNELLRTSARLFNRTMDIEECCEDGLVSITTFGWIQGRTFSKKKRVVSVKFSYSAAKTLNALCEEGKIDFAKPRYFYRFGNGRRYAKKSLFA
jgi:hypothetical protein